MLIAVLWLVRGLVGIQPPEVDYTTFYAYVEEGKVERLGIEGQHATATLAAEETVRGEPTRALRTTLPEEDREVIPLARDRGVEIVVSSAEPSPFVQLLVGVAPWLLLLGGLFWLSARAARQGGGLNPLAAQASKKFKPAENVRVRFDDVAGLASAKRDLQEVVQFLREPARFRRLGGNVPRGVLLVGPPGTGKTLLARAVAGESGVPFFSLAASEFIEMFVGVGASRVRALFGEAKKAAPAIVFIDEIDAVGRSRGAGLGGGHDEREQTLNQLLAELDGFDRSDQVVVLAATNRPDVLDAALLRPGRFDRRVVLDRPERAARLAILRVHARDKPLAAGVDLGALAADTPGFSGADLANLLNEAALSATRRGADVIEPQDIAAAYDKIVLGDPREAKLGPNEKHRVAVHESGHAIAAMAVPGATGLRRVSIIPRGMSLGVTHQTPKADRVIMTQTELEAQLTVLLGGYAAERTMLGEASTGAESDLKRATQLASDMVAHYGMSERVGPVYYEHHVEHPFLGGRLGTDGKVSDRTEHLLEAEARRLVFEASVRAARIIEAHRVDVERLVKELMERESLDEQELAEVLGQVRGAAVAETGAAPCVH